MGVLIYVNATRLVPATERRVVARAMMRGEARLGLAQFLHRLV
jgi:hypothetical protein